MEVKNATWVIVADSEKFVVFENKGEADLLDLRVRSHFEKQNPPTHEQGSDRPGRFPAPHGRGADNSAATPLAHGRVSALAETDWHQLEKNNAAHDLAKRINTWASRQDCSAIILVADPKTLGIVRGDLSTATKKKIIGEMDKDLTNHPVSEIEQALIRA